jgi:hypothetical protein
MRMRSTSSREVLSPTSRHRATALLRRAIGVVLELEVELELLLHRLADVDLVEALDVGHALEEEDALDELVGVLHLVDRLVADLLRQLHVAPVGAHLGVDEVLVDRCQLGRQDLVEGGDDLVVALHGAAS